MLLKLNNYKVKVKGMVCVDVRKQRKWVSKEDTTSPTVSPEGLVLSFMIDPMEGWNVATYDIP